MKLGSIFSNGVVLQRNQPIRIWGESKPNSLIKAEIAGVTGYAKSSGCGEFLLILPPLEHGGPFDLTVSLEGDTQESVTVSNVLIGEVWLCSGQSNMQYALGSRWATAAAPENVEPVGVQQEKEFIKSVCPADDIRFITIPMQVTGCSEKYFEASWVSMTSESAPQASAAAAWFAAEIKKELNVPVGLICCSWGGSMIETWISPTALRSNPDTRTMIEYWEKLQAQKNNWSAGAELPPSLEELLPKFAKVDSGNEGFAKGWADPEFPDADWLEFKIPGSWFDQNISEVGAVWVRKTVEIPAGMAGKDLQLEIGAVDKHDIAYFNGVEIGRTGKELETQYWNQPRCYKIPGELVKAGKNTIAIRAFSFAMWGGFLPPADAYTLSGDGLNIPLAGTWKIKVEYDLGNVILPPQYGIQNHNTPSLQFGSMIKPLLPLVIRGVLWYQGESNANSLRAALTYQHKMETMIKDWRWWFDLPDMPFIQVQLADYRSTLDFQEFSAWAALRSAQNKVCQTIPQVFVATALGTGEANDIHPQNKKEIGHRLAVNALHHVYNKDVLPGGPCCIKAGAENGKLRLFFQYADGMYLQDAPGKSFYLAGADGIYHPAETAVIEENTLLLSSTLVKDPQKVRYAWADNPNNILYNREYPAAAFECQI